VKFGGHTITYTAKKDCHHNVLRYSAVSVTGAVIEWKKCNEPAARQPYFESVGRQGNLEVIDDSLTDSRQIKRCISNG